MHVCSPTAPHRCLCCFQVTRLALPVPLFPFGIEGADPLFCCQSPCELRPHWDSAALLNCRNPLVSVLTRSHCLLITAQLSCWLRIEGACCSLGWWTVKLGMDNHCLHTASGRRRQGRGAGGSCFWLNEAQFTLPGWVSRVDGLCPQWRPTGSWAESGLTQQATGVLGNNSVFGVRTILRWSDALWIINILSLFH